MSVAQEQLSDLMRRGQQGDKAAYEELLHEVTRILGIFVRRRIGDPQTGEEVLQDILLSIHQARHSFNPAKPFKPWMFAIARYRLMDYFRKWSRTKGKEVDGSNILETLSDSDPAVPTSDRSVKLAEALAQLPERQRVAVELLKFEGLSVKETAARLGMSESAVKVTAHRAYRALRERFGADVHGNA